MEVNAYFRDDFRHYVPKIRAKAKDKVVRSVNDPGVKEEIHYNLYKIIEPMIPVDSGALRMSPISKGAPHVMLTRKGVPHYAYGDITRDNLVFDPYDKYGNHYASKVRGFNPSLWISRNKKLAYKAIKDAIVEGTK